MLNEIFAGVSKSFLAFISLERLYAIVWPFCIRTTSRGNYICDGVNWVGMLYLFVVFLITISCAYSVIWFFYKKKDPRLPPNRRERNKEQAKTLFIVTLLSLITWLPFTLIRTMTVTFNMPDVSGQLLTDLVQFLLNQSNRLFRMPLFRRTLRGMFLKMLKKMTIGLHVCEHQTSSETIVPVLLSIPNILSE